MASKLNNTLLSILLSCNVLSCGSPSVRENADETTQETDNWQYDITIPQVSGVNVHIVNLHDSPYTVFFIPQLHFHPFGSTSREELESVQLEILSLLSDLDDVYGINHFGVEGEEFLDYRTFFERFRGIIDSTTNMSDHEITNLLYLLMQTNVQMFNGTIGRFTAIRVYEGLGNNVNFFGLENSDYRIVSDTHLGLIEDNVELLAGMRNAFMEYLQCVLDYMQTGRPAECTEEQENYTTIKSNYIASSEINNAFFFNIVINQRNRYWAENIAENMQRENAETVVVVGGLGHKALCDYIEEQTVNEMPISCVSLIVDSVAEDYWNYDLSD